MRALLQYTLDLFDSLSVDEPMPLPAPEQFEAKRPQTPIPPAQTAIENIANEFPMAGSRMGDSAPGAFNHPAATREIRLGNARIGYAFARGKRRTIGFVVGAEGLSVRAPRWVALRDVDAALHEKADWILRKLAESRDRHDRLSAARIVWCDGAVFPFLGEPLLLRLGAAPTRGGAGKCGARLADPPILERAARELHIALPANAQEPAIRTAVQTWMQQQARRIFTERLDHFAPQLGVQWQKLKLSSAATRWGSASADGSIRLNWRLMHFALQVVDYVVVHELAHLRVMNHSPQFWALVASVVPDHLQLRRQLKDDSVQRW